MTKKTIMLVCSAGMSTSLLVTKMQKAAEEQGIDTDIFAVSASDADNQLASKEVDVLLFHGSELFLGNLHDCVNLYQSVPSRHYQIVGKVQRHLRV